ncbi:hypothetical protein EXN66_Car000307 [Channa argus]|uniref:Uncharacterized protein n=1 Tax=Channa argus TaxID=215402 RepID=A0A6G1QXA5_CHAAH|nr:hypothetical protein EXN66_Car000307 [Channa argus]
MGCREDGWRWIESGQKIQGVTVHTAAEVGLIISGGTTKQSYFQILKMSVSLTDA